MLNILKELGQWTNLLQAKFKPTYIVLFTVWSLYPFYEGFELLFLYSNIP